MQYGGFAEVYDRLMVPDFDYRAWAEYIDAIFKDHSPSITNILDCGCGTGLLSIELFKLGYKPTGLDISEEMLDIAASHARNAGAAIPFVHMDMCGLKTHRPMDAIISTCDGLNYILSLKELGHFFTSAHNAIKPGGLLCFDFSTRYKLENIIGNNTFTEDDENVTYIWRNAYNKKSCIADMELTFFIKQGGLYKRVDERHVQRGHSADEILSLLNEAGFKSISLFDAFSRDKPKDTSERIQFVAIRDDKAD